MRLEGKVALVTGGTRGIGRGDRGDARRAGRRGSLHRPVPGTRARGRKSRPRRRRPGDVRARRTTASRTTSQAPYAATVDHFGSLTTLVNSAISDEAGSGRDNHIDTIDNDTFESIMRVALMGTCLGLQVRDPGHAPSWQRVHRQHLGDVLAISAARTSRVPRLQGRDQRDDPAARRGLWQGKHPRQHHHRRLHLHRIPGDEAILDDPVRRAAFERNIMVPRFGEPADIAAGVVYLASDESGYVTGTELTIDGGALCHQALPQLDFRNS